MENNREVAILKDIYKKPKIHVASYWELKNAVNPVDVTSHSKLAFGKQLSPFYLGPVKLYAGYIAQNVENAWQYSKVYKEFVDEKAGTPSEKYFLWAEKGWRQTWADRHPRGKEIPLYSWWEGQKLDYPSSEKNISAFVCGSSKGDRSLLCFAGVLQTQGRSNLGGFRWLQF